MNKVTRVMCGFILFSNVFTASAATAVQIDIKSLLNIRPVITYTNGQLMPTTGGIDGGNYSLEATTAAAVAKGYKNPKALPDNGKFPANADHPEVILNFSNDAGTGNQVFRPKNGEKFTITVPDVKYKKMQIFCMGADIKPNEYSTLYCKLIYKDGSTGSASAKINDWFYSNKNGFNLAADMDKWGFNYEPNSHYLFGYNLNPDANKVLSKMEFSKDSTGTVTFWGATGETDSQVPVANVSSDRARNSITFGTSLSKVKFTNVDLAKDHDALIQFAVYDIAGKLLRKINTTVTSVKVNNGYFWDGMTNNIKLSKGNYIVSCKCNGTTQQAIMPMLSR
jgi:hypothetical protein